MFTLVGVFALSHCTPSRKHFHVQPINFSNLQSDRTKLLQILQVYGNFREFSRFTEGPESNKNTHSHGFAAVRLKLPRQIPHFEMGEMGNACERACNGIKQKHPPR